ncbi:TetR/AcrR family transcriptional regulator C-terminal domain-containing protein [Caproiciproducens sp.]|uniref:TetR/AcrR family transcriptional regulator C-terminal domain-containing protein n=1 Tax=Caproiciproducens sp. TaxID=1954376 RepID=UPI00289884D5|nr:TetR/AcrR family transcriptional regulator C-terminal domain-containing protein [Caproiciproducens sp.]
MEYASQTKQQLANSLKELMGRTPFNKITVQNVTSNCGLNRQTFYYHFKDMYELLSWIYHNDIFNEVVEEQDEQWETAVVQIMRYCKANRAFCRNTIRSIKKEYMEVFLQPVVHTWVEKLGIDLENCKYISKDDADFLVDFFTTAFVNYGIQWVSRGMPEDEAYVISKIKALLRMVYHGTEKQKRIAI